jgi:hypothetical protein
MDLDQFLSRWKSAAASERANYQLFLSELCDILGVPRPDPATGKAEADRYVFEKPVTRIVEGRESTGRIDLYKAGCFVLEAKQGDNDGLVSVLKQIHDALDAAVLNAYNWTDLATGGPLTDRLAKADAQSEALEQEILTRLVALNHERAKEEKTGLIRWLRPEYQAKTRTSENPGLASDLASKIGACPSGFRAKSEPTTATLIPMPEPPRRPGRPPGKAGTVPPPVPAAGTVPVFPWPADLPSQFALIKRILAEHNLTPTSDTAVEVITQSLTGRNTVKRRTQIQSVLATLQTLGHA